MPSGRGAGSSPQTPVFTPLNHVTVNGEPCETNVKPSRTICGVKAKIVLAAVLLLLLLIILTAAVVMIAVAAAKKEPKTNISPSEPEEEATSSTITVPVSDRVSCPLKTPASCVKGGCLYSNVDLQGKPVSSSTPKCFYPTESFQLSTTSNIGSRPDYVTNGTASNATEITAKLESSEKDSLTLIINSNSNNSRSKRQSTPSENSSNETDYDINFYPQFGFNVTRNKEVIFKLEQKSKIHVTKNFVSVSIAVPQYSKAYGLGNFDQLEKTFDDSIFSMWTRTEEEGAHPFVLLISKNGTATGLYVESSYPMDIKLQRDYNVNIVILHTEIKIRLFTGPTVAEVIKQYWSVIGTPVKPPYWGLGHFYGSELISSHNHLLELMQKNHTQLGQLPVEGILLPNTMNSASLPFSFSQETRDYIQEIVEKEKLKFIATVPPGISSSSEGKSNYMDSTGVEQKVFISRTEGGEPLQGYYSNKMVKYPDFTSSNTASWWYANLTQYSNGYGFHLHQNMPYSEINGSVGVCPDLTSDVSLATDILNLRNLEENTLCLSGINKKGKQIELHNKFSLQQAKITQSSLKPWSVSKQPLVVSDATSPGIGVYAGHFHDSNREGREGLKAALNEMITFNFLGVTTVGPNICTEEFSTPDACLKWYYLSVISPLAWSMSSGVSHLFAGNETFRQSVSTVLQFRQTLLPYHYDNQYRAHVSSEVPLRFLTFDYPSDERAALFQDQVLFGDAILYTPILITGEEFIVSYLPAGTWCNWVDGSCYQGPAEVKVISANSPASFTFLKGGTAVVTQNSANTTAASKEEKVRLIVVLDETRQANSTRFFDDGDTANTLDTKYYTLVNYQVANNTLSVTLPQKGYRGGVMKMKYERILIYGLPRKVVSLKRHDKNQDVRISSLISGDTLFYKLIVSDTNVDIELSESFQLKWELKDSQG